MTELKDRASRADRHHRAGQMGMPLGDAVYGLFALSPRVVSEMMSLPSAVVVGRLATTQGSDGVFPYMVDVDGLDEAGLG